MIHSLIFFYEFLYCCILFNPKIMKEKSLKTSGSKFDPDPNHSVVHLYWHSCVFVVVYYVTIVAIGHWLLEEILAFGTRLRFYALQGVQLFETKQTR